MDMGVVSLSSHNLSCHKPDSVREREREKGKEQKIKNERNKSVCASICQLSS